MRGCGGRLTPRQMEIAGLVSTGLTNTQIATRLHIGERTVKTHITDILSRINIHNGSMRVRLTRWVMAQDAHTIREPWKL